MASPDQPPPATFKQVLSLWPRISGFALDLAIPIHIAKQWKYRSAVPAEYWVELIAAAERREIPGITFELLARIAASERIAQRVAEARNILALHRPELLVVEPAKPPEPVKRTRPARHRPEKLAARAAPRRQKARRQKARPDA